LRREEIATLAGVSVDWYTRLEQGREVRPSRGTLESLARALRLSDDERGHLFALARAEVPPRGLARGEKADPSLLRVLSLLPAVPAFVLGRRSDVLAWNAPLAALLFDFSLVPAERRNMLWLMFKEPRVKARYSDWETVARDSVASFRAVAARYPDDAGFTSLINEMVRESPEFLGLWARQDVRVKASGIKFYQRDGGSQAMRYDVLVSPNEPDQRLVFYTEEATP
jgi:transcriptional regulator with XRE-family HTH domain